MGIKGTPAGDHDPYRGVKKKNDINNTNINDINILIQQY